MIMITLSFAFAQTKHSSESSTIERLSSENLNLVETILEEFLIKAKLPGLSIAVSKNENIIYAKGFGHADVEANIPMTSTTTLRTASVAKIMTATALGRLISNGNLDLDLPIKTYIPYIANTYADLTSRQLAGHTSGLEHRPAGNNYKKKHFSSTKEAVELMTLPLAFSPDTDYRYTTHAFNFLAGVIEGASGIEYKEFMEKEVFKPLEMNQTTAENIFDLNDKNASLYYFKKNKLFKEKKLTSGSYKLAGAGFRSTPSDLVKMTNAYSNGHISENTVTEMFESHQLKDGNKTEVGIAWRNSYDHLGNSLVEHAGSWRGARTVVVYYPEEKMSIAIMINADCQIFIEETAHILAQLFRGFEMAQSPIKTLRKKIDLTFYGAQKEEKFSGILSIDGNQGILSTESDGFLRSNSIYYLGQENGFVVITTYGLLFLSLADIPNLNGQVYLYSSRNTSNPTTQKPIAAFKVIE